MKIEVKIFKLLKIKKIPFFINMERLQIGFNYHEYDAWSGGLCYILKCGFGGTRYGN